MDSLIAHDITHTNGETTHYYEGGNPDGTPLIFIHGWPDIAESWKHQLLHFSSGSKYRVIAPDMRGYGDSSSPKDRRSYSLEVLTTELVELAQHAGVEQAVWIGHDWGCGVVSALAAHHPELFLGLAVLAVPYRTIELGLEHLVGLVNRDIYPADEYPYGQWEYMRYYELHSDESIAVYEAHADRITKALYAIDPARAAAYGKPSAGTARVLRDGGWFGGNAALIPDMPLHSTVLDAALHAHLVASHARHGFFPPTAYYLNHAANAAFAAAEKNGGVLSFPVLFLDAKHDAVCSTRTTPRMGDVQREFARDLRVETIDAGHWLALEKPGEVNEALGRWLAEKV
ncbi:hypothetical protein ACN47E_000740 [Coniothyrium glycines]